jgi:hypothetical protein
MVQSEGRKARVFDRLYRNGYRSQISEVMARRELRPPVRRALEGLSRQQLGIRRSSLVLSKDSHNINHAIQKGNTIALCSVYTISLFLTIAFLGIVFVKI